ncbi:hypothetical protein ElyMa_004985000 [Elysia marginata]|uniref:Uncharacterized protein n=1 Tax=Elysia marginata TaxID=1093978 RepID=A0AAV4J990_9GAST|nr:hypothetical protein ElyMa_004985000 [Elysia marginata]
MTRSVGKVFTAFNQLVTGSLSRAVDKARLFYLHRPATGQRDCCSHLDSNTLPVVVKVNSQAGYRVKDKSNFFRHPQGAFLPVQQNCTNYLDSNTQSSRSEGQQPNPFKGPIKLLTVYFKYLPDSHKAARLPQPPRLEHALSRGGGQ